jgi:hypothetical protein
MTMFESIVSLIFLVVGSFTWNPQLLIAAGAFAIASELNLRNNGGDDYEA